MTGIVILTAPFHGCPLFSPLGRQERVDQERERVGNGGFKPACTEAALCTVYAE